jgi:exonuclease VII large subunit
MARRSAKISVLKTIHSDPWGPVIQVQRIGCVDNAAQHLAMLNPQQVLARGYSLVQDAGGSVVSDASGLAIGAELRIAFAQG